MHEFFATSTSCRKQWVCRLFLAQGIRVQLYTLFAFVRDLHRRHGFIQRFIVEPPEEGEVSVKSFDHRNTSKHVGTDDDLRW